MYALTGIIEVVYPCVCDVGQPFVSHFRRRQVGAYLVGKLLFVHIVCSRDRNIAAKIHNFCGFLSAPMAIFLLPQTVFVIVSRQMVDARRQSLSLYLTSVLALSCHRRTLGGRRVGEVGRRDAKS